MFKKTIILSLFLGFAFTARSFGFDSDKLATDLAIFSMVAQTMASGNPDEAEDGGQGGYLDDYGLILTMEIYTEETKKFVSTENEDFMRLIEDYSPAIRQLSPKDKLIMIIKHSNCDPVRTYVIQIDYKDLLARKMRGGGREKFKERIKIQEDALTINNLSLNKEKLEMDAGLIGSLFQKSPWVSPLYLGGYGLILFYSGSNCDIDAPLFDKGDEEFKRLVTKFLPTIRQLKETDRIVIVVRDSSQLIPVKGVIIQARKQDLTAYQNGKLSMEKLMEKVVLEKNSLVVKKNF